MSEKKKGPGAGSTGASRNHVDRKSKPKTSRTPKPAQPFVRHRQLWLYDGQLLIGVLIVKNRHPTRAFDGARKSLGFFKSFRAAKAAINRAYAAAKMAVAA
jgi:hypothetical protein